MGAARWVPTTEDLEIIRTAPTTAEAAARLGKSRDTILKIKREMGIDAVSQPKAQEIVSPSGVWEIPEDTCFDNDLWRTLETLQQQMADLDTERDEVDITLPDEGPVLVVWLSDTHVGHTECDMRLLRHDLDLVRNTDGVYVILGGDLFDNVVTAVSGRGMHHQQLMPVRIQKYLVEEMSKYIKAKTLAMLLGNHDAWSISSDDFDPIAHLAKQIECGYLGAHGFVNLSLGEQSYRILTAHQFRMRSSFNRTHQAKRLEDFLGDADVTFTGHTHEHAGESTDRRGAQKFYGQAGSYVKSSRYGKGLGFSNTTAQMPGVVFWPNERRFVGFADGFRDGVLFLQAARQRHSEGGVALPVG